MAEKQDPAKRSSTGNDVSSSNESINEKVAPIVRNPFEDGKTELAPEEMENMEQFKEAQSERD